MIGYLPRSRIRFMLMRMMGMRHPDTVCFAVVDVFLIGNGQFFGAIAVDDDGFEKGRSDMSTVTSFAK